MSDENTLMATSPFYLLRSRSECWKCGSDQEVIALATRHVVDPEGALAEDGEPVVLRAIAEMPSSILRAVLAVHPRFERRTSKTADSTYFMNICTCGAHFGDFYLHSEPGGAFFPLTDEAASQVVIEELPVNGTFPFDCTYGVGPGAHIFEFGVQNDAGGHKLAD